MLSIFQNFTGGAAAPTTTIPSTETQVPTTSVTETQDNHESAPNTTAEVDTATDNIHANPSAATAHRLDAPVNGEEESTDSDDDNDDDEPTNTSDSDGFDCSCCSSGGYIITAIHTVIDVIGALFIGGGIGGLIALFAMDASIAISISLIFAAIYGIMRFIGYANEQEHQRTEDGNELRMRMYNFANNPTQEEYRWIVQQNYRMGYGNQYTTWFTVALSEYPQYYTGSCVENTIMHWENTVKYAAITDVTASQPLPEGWTPNDALEYIQARYMVTRRRDHRFMDYRTNPAFTFYYRIQYAALDIYFDEIDNIKGPICENNVY